MKVSDLRKEAAMLPKAKNRELVTLISKSAIQPKIPVGICKVWKCTKKEKRDGNQVSFGQRVCGGNIPLILPVGALP